MLLVVTRRQVVLPIDRLLAAARKLERGERGVSIGTFRKDEIVQARRAFEAMDVAIADREGRLAQALRELARALRPHAPGDSRVRRRRIAWSVRSRARHRSCSAKASLKRRRVQELLYPGAGDWDAELRAFEDFRRLAFEASPELFDEVKAFAPPSVRLPAEGASA